MQVTYPAPEDEIDALLRTRRALVHLGIVRDNLARLLMDYSLARSEGQRHPSPEAEERSERLEIQVGETRETYNAASVALYETLSSPGVIVTRWASSSEHSYGAKSESLYAANTTGSSTVSGFLIIAGIRTQTLFIGKDALEDMRRGRLISSPLGVSPLDSGLVNWILAIPTAYLFGMRSAFAFLPAPDMQKIVTRVVQARYAMYVQDTDSKRAWKASLALRRKDLGALAKNLELELEWLYSDSTRLGNLGFLGSPQIERRDVALPLDRVEVEQWQTILATEVDIANLVREIRESRNGNAPKPERAAQNQESTDVN